MNRFLIACLACLVLFPIGVAAQQGGYVGFGGGSSTWDIGFDTTGADRVDDSDTSFKLFVGFNISENAAFELAYADLGQASAFFSVPGIFEETDTVEATAISGALAGQLPLGETFALFGKVGFAFWDAEFTADGTIFGVPFSGSGDETGLDPLFGVGLVITPGETFALRLEFERYLNVGDGAIVTFPGLGSTPPLEGSDVDVLSASVLFRF